MSSYIESLTTKHPVCLKCKGKYYFPNDQKKTQYTVREQFGVLPDKCVNYENGKSRCPYRNK